jgi:hypothetical protein
MMEDMLLRITLPHEVEDEELLKTVVPPKRPYN